MNKKESIKKLLFFLLLLIIPNSLFCQNKIEGKIVDGENNTALEYSTVTLLSMDSIYISGALTNEYGYFEIPIKKNSGKQYILKVSSVGYDIKYQGFDLNVDTSATIILKRNINELNEISIIGKRSPIQNLGEKVVVNIDSYMNTAGKNTVDILKVLPGISFENESFFLTGKSITVYINDRPSYMTGKDLINYLSSLQGSLIEKVELLLNPTAKYDAGYNGAVVNIKLKRNDTLGINGSLGTTLAAWGHNQYVMPSLNLNFRSNNLNIYGGYTFLYNESENILEYERKYKYIEEPLQYNEKGDLYSKMRYHSYNVGIDYTISNNHNIGFLFKGINDNTNKDNDTRTNIKKIGVEQVDSIMFSPIKLDQESYNYQGNINYKWKIDSLGSQLSVDLNYMNVESKNKQLIPIYYFLSDLETEYRDETGYGQNVDQEMKLWSGKIDYGRNIFKDGEMSFGFKYDGIKRFNYIDILNNDNGAWSEDLTQSNNYNYKENIYATYLSFNKTFRKFYLSAGVRWELTQQKGVQKVNNEKFDKTYNDLFPSMAIQYNLKNNESFMLSYTRKISRPAFSIMNPFKFYTSPQTFQIGNADLQPSYNNSISMRYAKNKASLTLLFNSTKNEAVQEAFQDDETKILGYRYINWGSTKLYQASIYYPIKMVEWWSASLNVSGSYKKIKSLLNNENYEKDFFYYNASLYNTFQLKKGLSADLYFVILSDRWSTASHIKTRGHFEASITQDLWKEKASISLGIIDPFRWSTFRSHYVFQNIDEKAKEINNSRIIKLGFIYKFGSNKINKNQNRNTGVEDVQQRIY